MLTAKTVIPNKFWILESSEGIRKGTLSVQVDHVRAVIDNASSVYDTLNKACGDLSINIENDIEMKEEIKQDDNVQGYPTKCHAFNPIWDIKRKLPVFTKTEKSKTLHAAGYYIVKFEHGWVQSFCPKVSTLEINKFQGPFKDKIEMRERLRKENGNDDID